MVSPYQAPRCVLATRGSRSNAPGQYRSPAELGFGTQCLRLFIEDVDGHFAGAKAAGAQVVEEPHETVYGEYQYAAKDPEGHLWLFPAMRGI